MYPDDHLDNSVYSFMPWDTITDEDSPQYKLRDLYKENHPGLLYDPDGMADIYGRKVIACTEKYGDIGEEVEITFEYSLKPWRNDNKLFAIIGERKDESDDDPPCDEDGHLYTKINGKYTQRCVVEFIVKRNAFNKNYGIKDRFSCLKRNPVIKITKTGVNCLKRLRYE